LRRNVVIVVLDTLRKDHSDGLEELLDYGFEKVEDAISPSSWTLPSHVSMLTGLLPSQHRVHEGRNIRPRNLASVARAKVPTSGTNLLNIARDCGYTSICATGNPFVSPLYGFNFDQHHEFRATGEISAEAMEILEKDQRDLRVALALARKGRLKDLLRLFDYRLREEVGRVARTQQMEKGSKFIVDFTSKANLPSPFLLVVNLMEAHEAYVWGEDFMKTVALSALGRPGDGPDWRRAYPRHAELAISRGMEMISHVLKYDPLIVVTSDHGQLLGENGLFGHGYSLEDALVKVPFYIRYPSSGVAREPRGRFLSLTEVPGIVSGVIRDEPYSFGRDIAVAESFGYVNDLSHFVNGSDKERIDRLFQARARIFMEDGTVTFNRDSKLIEELTGNLTKDKAEVAIRSIPSATSIAESDQLPSVAPERSDEEVVLERLRRLGYE
jgi:hypothetical protein